MTKQAHAIPVNTLVEVKYYEWYGDGACSKVHARLFVAEHVRDCDGTPMYNLSPRPWEYAKVGLVIGLYEEFLTPVKVDERLLYGHGALKWDDR